MGPVGRMCGFSDAADAPDSGSRHFSLGGGGDAAVYNIPKRTLIRDQQSEMTFFAHLMLSRNLISSGLSSSRVRHPPRPWEARWWRPCQAIPVVPPPHVALQSQLGGHGSPETTPRVYRVSSRYYGAGTLRSTEGVPPYQRGWGRWMVRSGWGWCLGGLVSPGSRGAIGWRYGRSTPTCSPIPSMGRGLGWL